MLRSITDNILNGINITKPQVMETLLTADLNSLSACADEIRQKLCGSRVDLCSIINGKCGRCSEDCKFCVQSLNCKSELDAHGFIDKNTYLSACKKAKESRIDCFSIVTSGRTLTPDDYEKAKELYASANRECNGIMQCASHGLLTKEQLEGLKKAGIKRYHANLETSERYFPYICTTHTYADKISLIKDAQSVGLDVCSGGIIGIGETMEDRIDMAFQLKELNIKSIPINIYIPLEGTFFRDIPSPSYDEVIRIIAIFRFINPKADIRLAAGRVSMPDCGLRAFKSGANATITGDMLTTTGSGTKEDIQMLTENGFTIGE